MIKDNRYIYFIFFYVILAEQTSDLRKYLFILILVCQSSLQQCTIYDDAFYARINKTTKDNCATTFSLLVNIAFIFFIEIHMCVYGNF